MPPVKVRQNIEAEQLKQAFASTISVQLIAVTIETSHIIRTNLPSPLIDAQFFQK